jgi:osmotically-inducible protein OsmY
MRLLAAVGGFGLLAVAARPALAEAQPDEGGGVTIVRAPGAAQRAAVDAAITNDIKAKLENEVMLRHADVIISTYNGVVTLVGTVDTPFARDRAIDVATNATGVDHVDNFIRLNIASPNAPTRN